MNVFLSYTRLKDQFSKVSQFRERLENEMQLREPGSQVFQDTNNLGDGQHFPEELEVAIRAADVFLALVSPAYLKSEWCRREFHLFTSNVTDSSQLHRIVPVLWVKTPEMQSSSPDNMAWTLSTINHSDWRDLRYESWDQPQNQRVIGKLAENIVNLGRSPMGHTASTSSPVVETTSKHELTGIELVLIPGNRFWMGSAPGKGEENEEPRHAVTLSKFELGKYPVTREQYKRFLKENRKVKPPPFWDDRRFNQDRHPVVGVTWEAAQAYVKWAGLRLPTEAEWEYACRASSEANYCSGDTERELKQVGWYAGNSGGRLQEVGRLPPNAYGLCDLHGNVWEWCSDWYKAKYDPRDAIDPQGPECGDDRVLRGGTWYDPAPLARSAYRLFHHPASVISSVGFRVARGSGTRK